MPTKEFFAERLLRLGVGAQRKPPRRSNCFVASTLKTIGVRCPFVVRYPAFIEAPWMSGGRAEVNENGCRCRSDHTVRKGELQALLIGAHSGSQTMGLR